MVVLANIAAWSILAFGALLLAALLVAHEVGSWVGRRQARSGATPAEGVGVLVGGMLGLLAFVLCATTILVTGRIASPGMLLEPEPLPHLICSRPVFIGGVWDEASQHGDT